MNIQANVLSASRPSDAQKAIELWGGVECTVNRVGDEYFSQLERSGHDTRLDDLDRFATLGFRAMRYPVLWERVAPNGLHGADWSWSDERLGRLRELGVRPIIGLLHHGSGPRDTNLLDPQFPDKLAAFAGAVAQRYPWVQQYTPVNEPLTTARFSGLYGLWYPHARSEAAFKDALFNQCRGVVLSMRAIRQVNPGAQLLQTDDLGRTYSTRLVRYQASFNNHLRWLSWDLLCGRVDPHHQLWRWLTERCGASDAEVLWFRDNPHLPDIIGVNHYVTSNRFLDHRVHQYPAQYHGGNGLHRYVDVEATRVLAMPTDGIKPLLVEAWERYRLPIAVTEVHLDAVREEQMRWLVETWSGAQRARAEGVDIRALTVWGLLGSYDWNCLLTESRGYYESGAFDVRGSRPRPTAIATLTKNLAAGVLPNHPVLAGTGWWRRPARFLSKPFALAHSSASPRAPPGNTAPILIVGATGTLGRAFARICTERDLNHRLLSRVDMEIADGDSVSSAVAKYAPWAIVNAAGYVHVDLAERNSERCFRDNTIGPAVLATVCARQGVALATFSTDLVFNGKQQAPYVESDPTAPLSVYGKSKAQAEKLVLDRHPGALVIRTSSFFGPWDQHNFIAIALRALGHGQPFTAAQDMTVSPTYVPDLVNTCLDLLIDGEAGIWHLTNGNAITWADFALRAAHLAQVDPSGLMVCRNHHSRLAARRPRYSALSSTRSFAMPPLDDALRRYLGQSTVH